MVAARARVRVVAAREGAMARAMPAAGEVGAAEPVVRPLVQLEAATATAVEAETTTATTTAVEAATATAAVVRVVEVVKVVKAERPHTGW